MMEEATWTAPALRFEQFSMGGPTSADREGSGEVAVSEGRLKCTFHVNRWHRLVDATPTEFEVSLITVTEWSIVGPRVAVATAGPSALPDALTFGVVATLGSTADAEGLTAKAISAGLSPDVVTRP